MEKKTPYHALRDLVDVHSAHGVAEMAGCSYQTVYRAMRADPPKMVETLQGLSDVVGCDIGDWYEPELLESERERRRKIEQRRSESRERRTA